MAIVKASYTKQKDRAKASIRYIQNRPGRDGAKESRTLFGSDGYMERQEEKLHKEIVWTGVVHADHAPHRHVHVRLLFRPDLTKSIFSFSGKKQLKPATAKTGT